jgi:DNA-binding GntR family transcriptional regulator
MSRRQSGIVSALQPIAVRPETLSERVYEAIREAIVSRRLVPGERVTETAVAAQLSVSKTPVREALLRLEHVGLVITETCRGVSVVRASPSIIREAFEYRLALEVEACRLAAVRA